jgi:putative membrane protein
MGKQLLTLLVKLVVNALALIVVDLVFKGIWVDPNYTVQTLIAAAVILALVNTYLRPVLLLLTLPLNIVSLGLFTFVINALMLLLVSWLIPTFHVSGFWTALGAAVLISVISFLLNWFLRPQRPSPPRRRPRARVDSDVIDV